MGDDATPISWRPRPVPLAIKESVENEIQRLVHDGVLEGVDPTTTPITWASPIVVAKKSNGNLRICGDFRVTINPYLKKNNYPLPLFEELTAKLSGGIRFTVIDLKDAYLQMEVDEDSRELLVIATHLGYFRYTRLPFGVSVAPALFQNAMDVLLHDLPHVSCFLDDIIITGKDDTEHLSNVEKVLSRLEKIGLTTQRSKCKFLQESITYLGHKIDKDGIHPNKSSVQCLLDMPALTNTKELKSWLGSVNFYTRFIPMLQPITSGLYNLLRKDTQWKWARDEQKCFAHVKEKLSSCSWLTHYDPKLPLIMDTDASSQGIGAVLLQVNKDGNEYPVSFTSRILSPCEKKYSTIEREALAIVYGLKKFNQYLYGRHFMIRTDHKPLEHLFSTKRPCLR
ncbi:Transposon Tf2-8 polyprotein [Thelohanellus kitauei]|uniref:Transposon Tf2-8 polyprotein n=1 Tax=Thelohanellus kitauei TaxID=669202 RepID=A0A0C2MPB5_THEKT|nr:Transposon Tf2-8 polyprotein [Thelohanellus kitauei]